MAKKRSAKTSGQAAKATPPAAAAAPVAPSVSVTPAAPAAPSATPTIPKESAPPVKVVLAAPAASSTAPAIPTQSAPPVKAAKACYACNALFDLKDDLSHTTPTSQLVKEAREASHAADTNKFQKMIEELTKEVHLFEEAKKAQSEMTAKLIAKDTELEQKGKAIEEAHKQIEAITKGHEAANAAAAANIEKLSKRVAELEQCLEEEKKRASEVVIPVAEPAKVDVEEVVELKKTAHLNAAPPTDNSEEVARMQKEIDRLNEKNSELRARNHTMIDMVAELEKKSMANGVGAAAAAPSTSAAPAAEKENSKKKGGKKEEKKGDEEELVRAERRLVQSTIGKVVPSLPTLEDGSDVKAYEKWLKTVASSVKSAQEKAEKNLKEAEKKLKEAGEQVGNDQEVQELRAENERFREAISALELALLSMEQLKTEHDEKFVRRIEELEKKHGKAQIAEVRSAIDSLPSLAMPSSGTETVPRAAHSPPTSQSEDDGSWEVVA